MLLVLSVAALLAQSAAAAPADAPPPSAQPEAAADSCQPTGLSPDSNVIVVCAIKPDGYRINPDVMQARREMKSGGTPVRPGTVPDGNGCATVGPMGCRGVPTVNMLAVAATAAEISQRLAKGEEIGSVFVTDPHPSEYQLYLQAKRQREAKVAAAKAKAAHEKALAQQAADAANVKSQPKSAE